MKLTPEDLNELDHRVKEIGKHLGMEFDQEDADRQERDWNYRAILQCIPKRISFSLKDYGQSYADRFVIRGEFPRDKKGQLHNNTYRDKWPEITVAIDRGPEKIAKAIQGRLMPEYERQLATALENIKKSDAYHAGRLQILRSVAEYFGQAMPEEDDKAIYPPTGAHWGIYKIEAGCDSGEVKFELFCSLKKALQIFDILKAD